MSKVLVRSAWFMVAFVVSMNYELPTMNTPAYFQPVSVLAQESTLPPKAEALVAKAATWERYQVKFSLEAREQTGEMVQMEGSLIVQLPNRRRLEIRLVGEEELSQILVADGQAEWQYFPQAATVYRLNQVPAVPGPHRPFDDVEPESLRWVDRIEGEGEMLLRFEGKPRASIMEGAPVPIETIRIDVAEEDGLMRRIFLLDADGEAVLTQQYYDMQVNTPAQAGKFTFDPPEGVSVVEVQPEEVELRK